MALAVSALKQLEKAKEGLKSVDDSIKKVTGRDPNEARSLPERGRGGRGRGAMHLGRQHLGDNKEKEDDELPAKRSGGVFRRIGSAPSGGHGRRVLISGRRHSQKQEHDSDNDDEEEETVKPTVQSSVISTAKTITKTEVISAQNVDEKGKARNRRMFGMLLGTLAKFQSDESKDDHFVKQEQRRTEIERRLEEATKNDRKKAAAERRELYTERRSQQHKIFLLEQKVALAGEFEEWEAEWKKKAHFLITKTNPPVFFMPKDTTGRTIRALKDTQKVIEEKIEKSKLSMEKTLAEIDVEIESLEKENKEGPNEVENGDKGNTHKKGESNKNDDKTVEEAVDDLTEEPHVDINVESDTDVENKMDDDVEGSGGEENVVIDSLGGSTNISNLNVGVDPKIKDVDAASNGKSDNSGVIDDIVEDKMSEVDISIVDTSAQVFINDDTVNVSGNKMHYSSDLPPGDVEMMEEDGKKEEQLHDEDSTSIDASTKEVVKLDETHQKPRLDDDKYQSKSVDSSKDESMSNESGEDSVSSSKLEENPNRRSEDDDTIKVKIRKADSPNQDSTEIQESDVKMASSPLTAQPPSQVKETTNETNNKLPVRIDASLTLLNSDSNSDDADEEVIPRKLKDKAKVAKVHVTKEGSSLSKSSSTGHILKKEKSVKSKNKSPSPEQKSTKHRKNDSHPDREKTRHSLTSKLAKKRSAESKYSDDSSDGSDDESGSSDNSVPEKTETPKRVSSKSAPKANEARSRRKSASPAAKRRRRKESEDDHQGVEKQRRKGSSSSKHHLSSEKVKKASTFGQRSITKRDTRRSRSPDRKKSRRTPSPKRSRSRRSPSPRKPSTKGGRNERSSRVDQSKRQDKEQRTSHRRRTASTSSSSSSYESSSEENQSPVRKEKRKKATSEKSKEERRKNTDRGQKRRRRHTSSSSSSSSDSESSSSSSDNRSPPRSRKDHRNTSNQDRRKRDTSRSRRRR